MEKIKFEFSNIEFSTKNYQIQLQSVSYEPPRHPGAIDFHSHNTFEIHFISDGRGIVHLDDDAHPISKGMFYITGPDIIHAQTSGIENSMDECSINVMLKLISPPSTGYEKLLAKIVKYPDFIGIDNFDGAKKCIDIINEAKEHKIGYKEKIMTIVNDILISIGRSITESKEGILLDTESESINRLRVLDLCLREFRGNEITPEYLAERLFVSTRQLSRIIKPQYHMTLTEKIHSLRMEYAKKLLTSSTMSVNEISELSGYATTQHFCRIFKKYTGTTPSAYREKYS